MNPLIITDEVEVSEKKDIQKVISNLLDFDAWTEKNYQKYHKKHDNR